jgi:methyl-accepting chemotaxis protein
VVTWIVIGAALLGLVVLGLAVSSVLAALVRLRRAARPLLVRQAEAERLRVAAAHLTERIEALQSQELAQHAAAVIRAQVTGTERPRRVRR